MSDSLKVFRDFAKEAIEKFGRKEFERIMSEEIRREIAKYTRPDGTVNIEDLRRGDCQEVNGDLK